MVAVHNTIWNQHAHPITIIIHAYHNYNRCDDTSAATISNLKNFEWTDQRA